MHLGFFTFKLRLALACPRLEQLVFRLEEGTGIKGLLCGLILLHVEACYAACQKIRGRGQVHAVRDHEDTRMDLMLQKERSRRLVDLLLLCFLPFIPHTQHHLPLA